MNKNLKEFSIDNIHPRDLQISKFVKVKDLKEKILRCLKNHFENKIKNNIDDSKRDFNFTEVKLYNIELGIKQKKREILKLIYSYNTKNTTYVISAKKLDDNEMIIDVKNV